MTASIANAGVHPTWMSIAWNGKRLISWPSCPTVPVIWVSIGMRDPENHMGSSRSTETKTMASPAPTSTRPTKPWGTLFAKAKNAWPRVIRIAPPTIIRRGPTLSRISPTGTWPAAYTSSWTTEKVARIEAEALKRSVASSPATPKLVRWATAER